MNILVIGQSLEDHINFRGTTSVKPGGIYYSVTGLKSIINKEGRISLCTSVSPDKLDLFSPLYDDVDKSLFSYVDEVPKVYLNISEDLERGECYSLVNQNLSIEQIKDFKLYDGILINMITGFDITLDQLKEIRSEFKLDIFFDVHTLTRGLDNEGGRKFRVIPDFDQWAKNVDILQVNETEFSYLFEVKEEKEIIQKLFDCGIKILLVTKGELGAKVFYKKGNEIVSCFVSSIEAAVKNKVGCGDIFGAVFFYSYICNKNIENALRLANFAAGISVAYENLENIERFRNDVAAGFN